MQFIQDTNSGGRLGHAFSTGLQNLAQNKLQMIQGQYDRALEQQRYAKGLEPVVGTQAARFLSSLGPDERKLALQNIGGIMQLLGSPQQQGEQGVPMVQGQEQPQQAPGINNPELIQDIFTSPREKREKETLELKRMKTLEPKLNEIESEAKPARIVKNLAQDALKILKTGKAKTGLAGALTPKYLQSTEGQELISKLNQIVIQRAQLGKGVPSKLRLALEEGSKAAIWQKPQVIQHILEDILNDPELVRDIARDQARSELIDKYGSNLPNDIVKQIDRQAKVSTSQARKEKADKFTKQSLPSPKIYPEGAKAKNPITGEYSYIVRNGKWEEYNG